MFNTLILLVMLGIVVSLGLALYYLVVDSAKSERTVMSLTVRVSLAGLLLILLAIGFYYRYGSSL